MSTAPRTIILVLAGVLGAGPTPCQAPPAAPPADPPVDLLADPLAAGFRDPPVAARPGAFWCWLNGSISHRQITDDLQEMRAKGMGGAEIWDVEARRNPDGFVPTGPAFLGDQSVAAIAHAIREATRLGLRLGMVASSGWNAGGSWVPPKFAGKGLFWSRTEVVGPARVARRLPFPECPKAPKGSDGRPLHYREVAVLGLPAGEALADIDAVVDLSAHLDADGELRWQAPAGRWTVLRFVCSNHGQQLIVPSPNSKGPMIDFIDPAATEFHLRHILGRILAALDRRDFRGTAFEYLEFDSMELADGVLWSDGFADRFEALRGYRPIRYLPLLAGWQSADPDLAVRFRYDYQQTVSDQLIFSHYVTGGRVLREYGLRLVAEAGGPGPPIWDSCPVDAIRALGAVDVPRGEFWLGNDKHIFLIKEVASAAHVYGRPLVDAEAFTTWRRWIDGPVNHKRLADRALCEGLNHFTFHTFASSPPAAGLPGRAYHAGTDVNATATWWPKARPFMDYLARCGYLLRQGKAVADVCYYYGDQAPNFYPAHHRVPRKPVPEELGLGYDFDVCDSQTILTRMRVEDGRIVLPDGMSYALLALPDQAATPLAVLRKIGELVAAGATVVGRPPSRSPGLRDAGSADAAVAALAERLWNPSAATAGKVLRGPSWRQVLATRGIGPDFQVVEAAAQDLLDYVHRRTPDRDIYFVRNKTMNWQTLDCVFRVRGRPAQLWDPVRGTIVAIAAQAAGDAGTGLRLTLPPAGSVFVVFGGPRTAPAAPRIAGDGEVVPGPWTLRFPAGWGAPASVEFPRLQSWTASTEPGVRYFSGIATYEKSIAIPAERLGEGRRLYLDLGEVKDVAEVFVNGVSAGIVWTPPFRVEVTAALRPGQNLLRIEVANLWANRIIGDRVQPAAGRYAKTNVRGMLDGIDEPLPAGLLGPVRLLGGR